MPKVTLEYGDRSVAEYELEKEYTTIGRKPENDIQLENRAVSGQHARIRTILDDSFLEDRGSTNGTSVNGLEVKRHALRNGDIIGIGDYTLRYVNEAATQSADSDFDRTMIIRPDATGMPEDTGSEALDQSVGQLEETVAAESRAQAQQAGGKAWLRVRSGANAGKELELAKAVTTLGKPGVQVAVITRRPQGYFLLEIESKDGGHPTVDGKTVGSEAVPLNDGAVIQIQGVDMEFHHS